VDLLGIESMMIWSICSGSVSRSFHTHILHPSSVCIPSSTQSSSELSFVNQYLRLQTKDNGVIIFGLKPKAGLSWVKNCKKSVFANFLKKKNRPNPQALNPPKSIHIGWVKLTG
jgi:hypothetical protein